MAAFLPAELQKISQKIKGLIIIDPSLFNKTAFSG
jgi:hypothetical protein